MERNQLEVLARIVLPSEILDYFEITGVEQSSREIHIHLDELMNAGLSSDANFESKGFMEAVKVTDFPIRDHKVILVIRRRRWTDLRTGYATTRSYWSYAAAGGPTCARARASAFQSAWTSPAKEPVTPRSSGLF